MGKRLCCILTSIFILIMIPACKADTGEAYSGYTAKTIRIAHQRDGAVSCMVPVIIREKQLIEKYLPEGVSVEWELIPMQTDLRDALIAEKIDIAVTATSILITADAAGFQLVPVSDFVPMRLGLFSHHDDIKSVDDIQPDDKLFVTSIGTTLYTTFQIYCYETYGNAKQFENNVINMTIPEMWASVNSSDEIAVALLTSPDALWASDSELYEPILDLTPYGLEKSIGITAYTTEAFNNDNQVLVDAYRKASEEAITFARDNIAEAAALMAPFWEVDISVAEQELKFIPPNYEIPESGYNELASLMYEMGALANKPKMLSEFSNYESIPKAE